MNLDDLYRETIMDHNKSPRNRRALDNPTSSVGLFNPTCGDRIKLDVEIVDGRVADVGYTGHGCSISMASASMMSEAIKGKTVADALALAHQFKAFLTGSNDTDLLGDLEALQGVSQFPSRVKCATLAHNALEKIIAELNEKADL